jgi:hypothetical protein
MTPRIVMTLLVRDGIDLIDDWLRYHFARGVDYVIVTDHRSVDGTTDSLREEERRGRLRLFRESVEVIDQSAIVTGMARLAAVEHGADWVINSDADEFWWPRGGGLQDILAAVPDRFGVLRGLMRHFVLRTPEAPPRATERLTVRSRPSRNLRDAYHAQVKIVHRGTPDVIVSTGNHDADGLGLALVREWLPFEVLHFPLRTREQLLAKYTEHSKILAGQHLVRAASLLSASETQESFIASLTYDDQAVASGLATGELVRDTRLRDALSLLDGGETRLGPWEPTIADDVDLAIDQQAVLEHDAMFRLTERASAVQLGVNRLEGHLATRAFRRGRSRAQSSA